MMPIESRLVRGKFTQNIEKIPSNPEFIFRIEAYFAKPAKLNWLLTRNVICRGQLCRVGVLLY